MKILVCYDIPEQKIRSRVAKYLEGIGHRLQYSVFTVEETQATMKDICQRLSELAASSELASVFVTPLCQSCAARAFQIGKARETVPLCVVA